MESIKSLDQMFREARGKPVLFAGRTLVRIDRVIISSTQHLSIEFVETNSEWKQGMILDTKGDFIFNDGYIIPFRAVFWENTAPEKFNIQVKSKNKELIVYNVWDAGNGMDYWHNGAAMDIKITDKIRTYNCNDGYPDTDFNDLIFRIEILDGK